jgi:hypothetical protein
MQVTLYVKGNEFVNYLADPNGYPVVRSSASNNPSGGIVCTEKGVDTCF